MKLEIDVPLLDEDNVVSIYYLLQALITLPKELMLGDKHFEMGNSADRPASPIEIDLEGAHCTLHFTEEEYMNAAVLKKRVESVIKDARHDASRAYFTTEEMQEYLVTKFRLSFFSETEEGSVLYKALANALFR